MDTVKTIKGYELHERIGSGGFGVVHRATQTTVGREVAIKIILPHFANQPDFIRRFETEAQIIARLEHSAYRAALRLLARSRRCLSGHALAAGRQSARCAGKWRL